MYVSFFLIPENPVRMNDWKAQRELDRPNRGKEMALGPSKTLNTVCLVKFKSQARISSEILVPGSPITKEKSSLFCFL